MIRWFKDIEKEDFLLVGGKGHNLSKLFNSGIKVPNGFVILSSAYEDYVKDNQLENKIDAYLSDKNDSHVQSESIKALFKKELLSDELKTKILDEFYKFKGGKVAVRSSSTVEDLPGMSFAGQYSSFLNVQKDELLDSVVECWQSLWNDRAIEYRKKNRVQADFSHAVVVQEMIEAKVSGVVFTSNPVNGIRHEIIINASFGLGEAIVSGLVNPDQYTLDKESLKIISHEIALKEKKCIYGVKGIQIVDILSRESSLSEEELKKLVVECLKVEDYFTTPQDIEFAISENDEIFILQSREITTLFPIDQLEQDGKTRVYMGAGTVLLGMREPFTPLGFEIMSNMFPTIINVMTMKSKPLTNNFVKYAGNRMYVDMTYLMSSKLVAKQFAKSFSGNDLPLKDVMYQVIEKYGKVLKKQGIHFRIPLGVFKYGLRMSKRMRVIKKIDINNRYDAMIEEGNKVYKEQYEKYLKLKSNEEKLDFCDSSIKEAFILSQTQALYCIEANDLVKIDKALKKKYGNRFNSEILIHALPRCFTQELTIKLNLLAKHFDEKGLEVNASDPEFIKVLDRFGHRGNTELDFGTKRWNEDPVYLVNQVKSYLKEKMYERNLEDIEDKKIQLEALIEEIYTVMKNDSGIKKAEKFRKKIISNRIAAGMREYPKSDIVRIMELGRKAVLSIGDVFVSKGLLDSRDDIFFLNKKQILDEINSRAIVEGNKESYMKEMARVSIPRMIVNNGETFYSSAVIDPNSKVLQGKPLSPGIYEGMIKVVLNPIETDLIEGEIMVTESTNPAWTPLFATAGALIMEYGGPMSHGGVVAREYGLPAVVGITNATEILEDGQRVKVNGETGVIEILS